MKLSNVWTSALVRRQTMEEIQLEDNAEVNAAAGVTYAWRDLNVYAGGGNMIRKRPKAHILKNGELQIIFPGGFSYVITLS